MSKDYKIIKDNMCDIHKLLDNKFLSIFTYLSIPLWCTLLM